MMRRDAEYHLILQHGMCFSWEFDVRVHHICCSWYGSIYFHNFTV